MFQINMSMGNCNAVPGQNLAFWVVGQYENDKERYKIAQKPWRMNRELKEQLKMSKFWFKLNKQQYYNSNKISRNAAVTKTPNFKWRKSDEFWWRPLVRILN